MAVSHEHVPHAATDQEFAAQEAPFQEYQALQLLAVLDSDPLVETTPLEQAKFCW